MRRLPFVPAAVLAALVAGAMGCGSGGPHARHAAPPSAGSTSSQARPARPAFQPLALPARFTPRTVRIPILTYHRVHRYATELKKSQPDLTVEPESFRAQMQALHDGGYRTITQRQLFDALYRGAALPAKPVLVSVDDGYVDDVTEILPVLRRLGMTATFYVITGRLHEQGFVNPDQVRQLEAARMDIGAHTRTHVNLPALPEAARRSEIDGSAADLRGVLGHPVYWFAYPYGAFSPPVVDEVRRAGFLLAVTTKAGVTASTAAPLEIPRIHVGRNATAASVLSLVGGG